MKKILLMGLILCCIGLYAGSGEPFFWRAALYQDFLGFKSEGVDLYSRLSSRLQLTLWHKPGDGWTVSIDVRSRNTLGDKGKSQWIIYDARLSYDRQKSRLFLSLGQMNLYDTAGIGELTGAVIAYKPSRYLSLGGYGGLEPDLYNTTWDTGANKFGLFVRYAGPAARQFALSLNRLGYDGKTERQYLYSSLLFPFKHLFVLYGNVEYELGSRIKSADRLSRLFLNARLNLSQYIDITANYSSGRGLDFRRFLLEQSQDPDLQNGSTEIERYYYNEVYGVRLSIKPTRNVRLYIAKRESERKDRGIENHTLQLGLSLFDILKSGISLYGNYNMNRGDASESDAYYVSVSRSFSRLSLALSFANTFNGVRFVGEGTPQVFHLPERKTISADLSLVLSRALVLALDYAYSTEAQGGDRAHQFFIRVIFRK